MSGKDKEGQQNQAAKDMDKSVADKIVTGNKSPEAMPSENGQKEDSQLDLAQKIKTLEDENADLKDKILRKYAEFENFRKRMTKDKDDSIRYANSMILLDMVNVIDNFERALKSAEESKDFAAFHSGVALIEKQMTGMLETKYGLTRFFAKDTPFDPERHEAIMSEESKSVTVPTVLEDFQSGYTLHGRILRPAKVKIGQPASGQNNGVQG